MENSILSALKITGISLVILLLILTFLAFLVNGMTSLIKSKDDKEDEKVDEEQSENQSMSVEQGVAEKVAALGVSFALAELDISPVAGSSEDNDSKPWRGFHRARRLNQTIRTRRN